MPTFEYTVDGEPHSTTEHVLSARQVLESAGVDTGTHYLVLLRGESQESFKDKPDEPIHMHEHMRFISVYNGPTPVSRGDIDGGI